MLTIKQQGFADAILKGYNYSDAYRMVYNTQNMSEIILLLPKDQHQRLKALVQSRGIS